MGKSAKKQFAELGVEVYEVGVNQARGWFGWRGCKYTGRDMLQMSTHCETMRKGAYLVVVGYASFGYQGPTLTIYGDGSVYDAVWLVQNEIHHNEWAASEEYFKNHPYLAKRYMDDFEVWHLVDDAELWQEWDNASAAYIATHQPEVPQYQSVIVDEQDTDYGRLFLAACSAAYMSPADDMLEALLQLREAGEQYEYSSGFLSGSLARAEAFVDA